MNEDLQKVIENWKEIRQLTLDLLEELPEEHLPFTPGEHMGTFGKQFRHIGDVQICYSDALLSQKIDFSVYKRDYSLESSKKELSIFLNEVDTEMLKRIEETPEQEIDWYGEGYTIQQHIKALIEHEILHQGELVVYMRLLGIPFPKSWELWGLYEHE